MARASLTLASAIVSVGLARAASSIRPFSRSSANTSHHAPRSLPSAGRAACHAPSSADGDSRYWAGKSRLTCAGGLAVEQPARTRAATSAVSGNLMVFIVDILYSCRDDALDEGAISKPAPPVSALRRLRVTRVRRIT